MNICKGLSYPEHDEQELIIKDLNDKNSEMINL